MNNSFDRSDNGMGFAVSKSLDTYQIVNLQGLEEQSWMGGMADEECEPPVRVPRPDSRNVFCIRRL